VRPLAAAPLALVLALSPSAAALAASRAEPAPDPAAATTAFEAALAAQQAGDAAGYRDGLERAAALLPDPTRLLYRLAGARLAAGDRAGALDALRRQVDAGFLRDPRPDPQLAALVAGPELQRELSRLDELRRPVVASEPLFALAERAALFEGIAHHPADGSFFFSSVHEKKVVRRARDGSVADFARVSGAALGLAVDEPRRLLWVVSAGLPQAKGLTATGRDRSALVALDLDTGAPRRRVDAPAGKRWWNDLVVAADGTVYVSDSGTPSVARVAPDGAVSVVVEGAGLRSPGGLALDADERILYVADWTNGLALIDLASGALAWLRPPAGATVLGIDGLRRHGDGLIAIQNGVPPQRITRFHLAPGGRALDGAELLERAVPGWDEPTLGVVVDGALVYIATSQWPKFGDDGATPDPSTLTETTLRRLPLKP
jgi:sugar lactone lactonase YvrE